MDRRDGEVGFLLRRRVVGRGEAPEWTQFLGHAPAGEYNGEASVRQQGGL